MNLCLFSEVFRLRPLTPYELRQMKSLMKIHNRDKFHHCTIYGCQVINLPIFSWHCNIHEMALFSEGGGRGDSILTPQILPDFAEHFTRGSIQRHTNSV